MDRKTGALRRLHVMPISGGQLLIGTMLSFGILSLLLLTVMTSTAVLAFDMPMPDNLVLYAGFALLATVMLIGLGFAISGISKTPSQADVYGQIVFFGSLALGGVWVPQAFMPDIVRTISRGIPLTPVIDGLQLILHSSPTLIDLLPQIAVLVVWILITYTVGIRTFRWE
jgi:ABC-2 type transport system permease protein